MKRCIFLLALVVLFSFPFIFAWGYDEGNSMVKVSGSYGMSFGIQTDQLYWKKANADYQEKNWRYLWGQERVNTYDPRIFDRYQLEIETSTRTPWNGYMEVVVDPWSFAGRGQEIVSSGRDHATIEYRYWEATGKTINEQFRTFRGNFVNTTELKVIDGKVTQDNLITGFDWSRFMTTLSRDRSVEIDYLFKPIRKAWIEYKEEPLYIKIFPISDQSAAFTSDDPLVLSNNHVYYAPSPWLFSFDPGMQFDKGLAIQEARWDWDLAWFAEDSNRNYLTFLRGFSFGYELDNLADVHITAAAPLSLWDYYDHVDSVPIAGRLKLYPTQDIEVGSTYTVKYGLSKKDIKGFNEALGVDVKWKVMDVAELYGEGALSYNEIEHPAPFGGTHSTQENWDQAYKVGIKAKGDIKNNRFKGDLSFTTMGERFAPGLSDYKDTRVDRDWGRHIRFEPVSPEDEAIRIGDSIDVNRYVIGLNTHANFLDDVFDFYFNFRNAHKYDSHKFVENIMRFEGTCNPPLEVDINDSPVNVQLKGLFLHRLYPRSIVGLDPFLKDRYTDAPYINAIVADQKNTDLMTFSGGAKIDLLDDKVSIYGIFETTNDPQNFPRQEFNGLTWELSTQSTSNIVTEDNIEFNRLQYFLYGQYLFDLPPYDFYNIWKGAVTIRPMDDISIKYTHVTNGNKNYAALFDKNHNHDSIDIIYKPHKNITVNCGYMYSKIINLVRANDTGGVDRPFKGHHNIYAQLDWYLKNDQRLTFQFGEIWLEEHDPGVFGTRWPSTNISVLDTRKIFRVFLQGKF